MTTFVEGMIAGYGIAIPVGAIAILIIETALRGGFRPGFAAGAGAATADFVYALIAAIAGGLAADLLAPFASVLKVACAAVLLALGGWGMWRASHTPKAPLGEVHDSVEIGGGTRTYGQFLGLTLLNPLTVAYFTALILGGSVGEMQTIAGRVLFVIGAGLASLSWQTLLAGIGALAHRHLSPRFRVGVSVAGNLVVIGLGLRILIGALLGGG